MKVVVLVIRRIKVITITIVWRCILYNLKTLLIRTHAVSVYTYQIL